MTGLIIGGLYNQANNASKEKDNVELSFAEWISSMYDPKLVQLIIGTSIILGILGAISFNLYLKEHDSKFKEAVTAGTSPGVMKQIMMWINNQAPNNKGVPEKPLTTAMIGVSMVFGIIFGFIDNAGLFFGMEALDPYVSKVSKDPKVAAGIGNTFSDVIGAFAGSFAGSIVTSMAKAQIGDCFEGPMWAEAVGIFFGCGLGIVIPKMITS